LQGFLKDSPVTVKKAAGRINNKGFFKLKACSSRQALQPQPQVQSTLQLHWLS
jgi:hypothetical protein